MTEELCALADRADVLWTGLRDPDICVFDPKKATALILSQTTGEKRVNIVRYVWEGTFQDASALPEPNRISHYRAWKQVQAAGTDLAKQLISLLGSGYNKPIHFIGHSLGTAVNTYAANLFLKNAPNVLTAQFTALDRPHHVNDVLNCRDGVFAKKFVSRYQQARFRQNLQ